jgi:hypothetical protein
LGILGNVFIFGLEKDTLEKMY